MITLYHSHPSSNSWKSRLVLAEKELPYQSVLFDLAKRDHKSAQYLAIHPFGTVPALKDGEFVVYDSTLIGEYLEDAYSEPSLLPGDATARSRARTLEDFRDAHFHLPFVRAIFPELRAKPPGQADRSVLDPAIEDVQRMMERLERELGDGSYFGGDGPSLADTALIPNFAYLDHFGIEVPFPGLRTWFERCKGRPSYAAAHGIGKT